MSPLGDVPRAVVRRSGQFALALLTAGCVSADILRLDSTPRPETDPTTVELLAVEPDRPFTVIALVSVSTGDRGVEALRSRLVREAAKLGGQAVLFDGQSLATDKRTSLSARVIIFSGVP